MKKITRRSLLVLLSFIPINSIAFASDFALTLCGGNESRNNYDYEKEMVRRLEEGSLPNKYRDFMEAHNITSIKALFYPENRSLRDRLRREFISDLYDPKTSLEYTSGSISNIFPPSEK